MKNWNGKSLLRKEIDLTIDSDGSLTGWGASCLQQRTGGPWPEEEKLMHINCLELLAATHPRPKQHHGSSIYKQTWGHSHLGTAEVSKNILHVVPGST